MYQEMFFLILATAIRGMPMPEICFLPGKFRRTILAKDHHGDSLSGRGSNAQPSEWEAD